MTAVESAAEAANTAWYVWAAEHAPKGDFPPDMNLELHEAFCAGFGRGARFAVVQTSKLSNTLASLSDFLDWLRAA